jgi:hypothetical protein
LPRSTRTCADCIGALFPSSIHRPLVSRRRPPRAPKRHGPRSTNRHPTPVGQSHGCTRLRKLAGRAGNSILRLGPPKYRTTPASNVRSCREERGRICMSALAIRMITKENCSSLSDHNSVLIKFHTCDRICRDRLVWAHGSAGGLNKLGATRPESHVANGWSSSMPISGGRGSRSGSFAAGVFAKLIASSYGRVRRRARRPQRRPP